LQALNVDVLLQDELTHPSLFWLNHYLKPDPPRISIVHHLRISEQHPPWLKQIYAEIERRYLQSVNGFIFNSQTTASTVNELLADRQQTNTNAEESDHSNSINPWMQTTILSPDRLKDSLIALPAGDRFDPKITDDEIEVRAYQKGPLRLVFLGNLIARKGLHTLLAAVALLPPGTAELAVIGSPATEPAYAQKMRSLVVAEQPVLASRVRFLGALEDKLVAAQLRRAHVLVVPSSYEGYGIVYLEGMSFGLPAIAGGAGAAGEIITPGQNGFLIQADDAPAIGSLRAREIAEVIAGLAVDRQRLLALSLAARRRYLAQPTWNQTAALIRNFLLGLSNYSQQ
jgi:glycosyltransferase involved in cell wall biosynthesis